MVEKQAIMYTVLPYTEVNYDLSKYACIYQWWPV